MTQRLLLGVKVADFTWIGAGSFTTKLFADMGADVIKIESSHTLDQLRQARPFKDGVPGLNRSGYFSDRNSSKRSITMNLKTEKGRALVRELIRQADVIANNFTPGVMEKFGLGYDEIRAINPRIVYLSMSMQGQEGPGSKYLGFGLTMGALTGLQEMSGLPDRLPLGSGTNFADHIPNPTHGAFSVLVALRHARRTGVGQMIDLAQTEPTVALLGPTVLHYTVNGRLMGRRGNRLIAAAPYGVYPCTGDDKWVAIAAVSNAAWMSLVSVLGCSHLTSNQNFVTADARLKHADALDRELTIYTSRWSADELAMRLQACGVAAGLVSDASDVLYRDPQLLHREHWAYLDHTEVGRSVYSTLPFRFSQAAISPMRAAPCLGEHTDEVCRDVLGLDDRSIADLRESGVLS